MTGYAHHAYTIAGRPLLPARRSRRRHDRRALAPVQRARHGRRAHAIPARMPIYLTEFGVQSEPNKQLGVPVAEQAEYDAIAEQIAWCEPARGGLLAVPAARRPARRAARARACTAATSASRRAWSTSAARRKPLYFGWPVPLTVTKRGHGFSLWGLVRPADGRDQGDGARASRRARSSYRTLKTVHDQRRGYWSFNSSRRRARTGACAGRARRASRTKARRSRAA